MDVLSDALMMSAAATAAAAAAAAAATPWLPSPPAWQWHPGMVLPGSGTVGDGPSRARSRSRSPAGPAPRRVSVPSPEVIADLPVVIDDQPDVIALASPVPPDIVVQFGPFLTSLSEPPGCPLGCSHWVSPLFRAVHQFRRANAYSRKVYTEHMCVGTGAEFLGMEVKTFKC